MTEQLALNLSDMVKDTLSGRDMATREGFPEEVTSGTSRVLKKKTLEISVPGRAK